jgi:hypothetical protein
MLPSQPAESGFVVEKVALPDPTGPDPPDRLDALLDGARKIENRTIVGNPGRFDPPRCILSWFW